MGFLRNLKVFYIILPNRTLKRHAIAFTGTHEYDKWQECESPELYSKGIEFFIKKGIKRFTSSSEKLQSSTWMSILVPEERQGKDLYIFYSILEVHTLGKFSYEPTT